MQPAVDSTTLDRLIALGREHGHLTTEDLRTSLPVERMTAQEIASIVVYLEETGIPVELEQGLLSPYPKPVPQKSAEIIPFPGPRARKNPKAKHSQPAKPVMPEPRQDSTQDTPFGHWLVATAGLLAFAAISLIIFATAG
jgi:hypothetical protein